MLAADNTARMCSRCLRDQSNHLRPPTQLEPEFFETAEFRAAFESQHIGKVFKAYRNHPRFLQRFGKPLNQELLGRWLGIDQARVSKMETRKPKLDIEALQNYAQILQLPQHLLWYKMPGQTGNLGNQTSASGLVTLPSSLSVTSQPGAPLLIVPNVAGADPQLRIRRLVDARAHFEQMYRNSGGLVAGTRIELFLARQALPLTSSGNEVERKAIRATGSLIALAGVCAYDSEDWLTANAHFTRALTIAESSQDESFRTYVLALMVNQALALEDFKTAENLANIGLQAAENAPAPQLTIDLQAMKATALAAMGEKSAAMAAIHKLEANISKLSGQHDIAEASYAQEGHLHARLAEALTSLGDLKAAHRYGERSILSDAHARGKVNRLASMVTLEVARGEVEHAASLASEMIDSAHGMESRRLRSRFEELRNALASRPTAVSREVLDRLDIAITLMP